MPNKNTAITFTFYDKNGIQQIGELKITDDVINNPATKLDVAALISERMFEYVQAILSGVNLKDNS